MKKRSIKLLGMTVAFGVLLAGYGLVSHLTGQEEETGTAETITVAAIEEGDIASISWTYGEDTVSLTQEANGGWVNSQDDTMPIDKSKLSSMLTALESITSSRTIEAGDDLEEYGLETPDLKIRVTEQDGTVLDFLLGDYNSISGKYYMLYQNAVYLVDSTLISAYSLTEQDLIAYETLPDLSDTERILIFSGESRLELCYLEEGMEAYTYAPQVYCWFSKTEEGYQALSSKSVSSLKSEITGMEFLTCESWNAGQEELAQLGLSDPAGTITITYREETGEDGETDSKTVTLNFGSYTEEGCYVALEGSCMVYTIDADTADALLMATEAELLPDEICQMELDTVDSMEITMDGATSVIEFTHLEEVDEEGNSTTVTESRCGEDALDTQTLEDVFDVIGNLTSQGKASSSGGQRETVLSICFRRNTEYFQTLTLTFTTYDSSSYLVSFQDASDVLVSKSSVRDLMDALDTALNSQPEEDSE